MFSLSALGTLFMYIMARKSKLHNAIMLASILPIAFTANIIRVMVLVLVTYHFGDDPSKSNEGKLEAIQMAWYDEWKDNQE